MATMVSPKASATPNRPIPTCGNAAASTALPQPPKTSQKVPMNSAASFLVNGMVDSCLLRWSQPQRPRCGRPNKENIRIRTAVKPSAGTQALTLYTVHVFTAMPFSAPGEKMLSILVCHSYFLRLDQKQIARAKPYPPLATLQVV